MPEGHDLAGVVHVVHRRAEGPLRSGDVNGDGSLDFLYHRYFSGDVQQGAYLNPAGSVSASPAKICGGVETSTSASTATCR